MFNNLLLNQLVERSGLSLTKLGKELGVTHSTLSLLIRGLSINPHPDTINSIANYFKISPEQLFLNNSNKNEYIQDKNIKLESLSEVLRYLMLRSGIINSSHLHQYTGVSIQTIDRILQKETESPNINTLGKLASFFNLSIAQLKGLEEIPGGTIFTTIKSNVLVPLIAINDTLMWAKTHHKMYIKRNIKSELVTLNSNAFAVEVVESPKLKINYVINPEICPEIGDTVLIRSYEGNLEFVEKVEDMTFLTKNSFIIKNNDILGVVVEELRYRM